MGKVYRYEEAGRRPVTVCAAGVFGFLFWVAATNDAPWYIRAIWSVAAAMLAYLLIANPRSGIALSATRLEHYSGRRRTTHALTDIDHVEIQDWSDSTDFAIVLRDGTRDAMFSGAAPNAATFERELALRGVAVRRR